MIDDSSEALRKAARLFRNAGRRIALTGAGISVESGIPSFRGSGGIWERWDPSLLEIERFMADPRASWEAIRAIFYEKTSGAEPNAAHRVLARWEEDGLLDLVVTQNIDGLHGEAGSRRVAEFHGTLKSFSCLRCGARIAADRAALEAGLLESLPPRCAKPSCRGLLKPDFVFFGEAIPPEVHARAFRAAAEADFCLVVGSTGLVYPAAQVPMLVAQGGSVVVEIDPGFTEFSAGVSAVHIGLGAVEGLTRLDALIRD